MKKDEKDFSKAFVDCLKRQTWVERIEPSRGMQSGIPDIFLLLGSGDKKESCFIELKVGTIKNDLLFSRDIRPAQFSWHKRFKQAGGLSFACIGVGSSKEWQAYFFDMSDCVGWRKGIDLNKSFLVCNLNDETYIHLNSAVNRF